MVELAAIVESKQRDFGPGGFSDPPQDLRGEIRGFELIRILNRMRSLKVIE